jgi:excisionase family DNA binding protein
MFTVELRFKENGRDISLDQFADEITRRFAQVIKESFPADHSERQGSTIYSSPAPGGVIPPKAVGIKEAARLLGIRPPTLRVMVMKQRIRVVRIGRRVLVPMETIEQVLQEGIPRRG